MCSSSTDALCLRVRNASPTRAALLFARRFLKSRRTEALGAELCRSAGSVACSVFPVFRVRSEDVAAGLASRSVGVKLVHHVGAVHEKAFGILVGFAKNSGHRFL